MEDYERWSPENSERIREEGLAGSRRIFKKPATKEEREAIVDHLEKHGLAIVQIFDDKQCLDFMVDAVKRLWMTQPWKETLVVRDPNTGAPVDIDKEPKKFMRLFTKPASEEALEHYRSVAPLHCVGFGASADPSSFHSELMEMVRTDKALYKLARKYLRNKKLWIDINRTITKLTGASKEELLHWDKPVMFLGKNVEETNMCAKLLVNDEGGSFVYVPGTHTAEFRKVFTSKYRKLYPNANAKDAKFGLDPDEEDPMDIFGKRIVAHIPAGCAVFWSSFLCHGVQKNKGQMQIGMYFGYMPEDHLEEVYRRKRIGMTAREDRIRCVTTGKAPTLYPSGDPVHYYPKRYKNFLRMLKPYTDKTREDWPGLTWKTVKKTGQVVRDLVPVLDPKFKPYRFNKLGRRLVGLSRW